MTDKQNTEDFDAGCGFGLVNTSGENAEWKILLPVDDSVPSMRAAMYLVDLIEYLPSEVTILQCWEPPMLGRTFTARSEQAEKDALISAQTCAAVLERAGLIYSVDVRMGRPAELIVQLATDNRCDLIVMGSRGHTGLEGLFLGSVTLQVLKTAPCPVLVV